MSINRITLLGGSGFVGSHLVAHLSNRGIACRVVTRHPQRHRQLEVNPGCHLMRADLFDSRSLADAFEGSDAVINLIGILNEQGGQTFRRMHVELVDQIVEACQLAGVKRLLHMSALHANEAQGSSRYLRSKGEGENRAHTHGGASMAVTSFRPSVIFGPCDGLFNRFAGLLRLSPLLFPLACPQARFAPVYVGDVAKAFARALEDPSSFDRHYDLCGPQVYSLRELVAYTAATLGLRRYIIGLGDLSSRLQAHLLGHLPGKPFSWDNYLSLQTDSVCDHNDLETLGIHPTPIDAVVPHYLAHTDHRGRLNRYRRTGLTP